MNQISGSPIQLATPTTGSKALPPLRRGLTVAAAGSTELLHPAKMAFIQAMLTGSRDLPVPMPKFEVVHDMIVGSPRYLDHFKSLQLGDQTTEGTASYKPVHVASSMPIDWTGPGGLMLLGQHMKGESKAGVVLIQHCDIRTTELALEGLISLQRKARNTNTCVVLVTELEKPDRATCCRISDDFFELSKCEPDPGWDNAFIIDCVELSRIPGLGQSKVMCNFKFADGVYKFGFTPFVSEHVDVRLMAILKALGMTLKDIGSLIAKDKSNVSRDLSGVPLLKKMIFTMADLSRWLEACRAAPEQIRKGMAIFAEFAKTDAVARRAKAISNDRNLPNTTKRSYR